MLKYRRLPRWMPKASNIWSYISFIRTSVCTSRLKILAIVHGPYIVEVGQVGCEMSGNSQSSMDISLGRGEGGDFQFPFYVAVLPLGHQLEGATYVLFRMRLCL